jgi:hypothetical protein
MSMRRALPVVVLALVGAGVGGGCSDDGGSVEGFCTTVREDTTIGTVFSGGFDPTDTDTALDQLRSARVTLGDLRDEAPDEVRGALSTEIDYVEALVAGIDGTADDEPEAVVALVQRITDEHPGVGEAASELAAFARDECGA